MTERRGHCLHLLLCLRSFSAKSLSCICKWHKGLIEAVLKSSHIRVWHLNTLQPPPLHHTRSMNIIIRRPAAENCPYLQRFFFECPSLLRHMQIYLFCVCPSSLLASKLKGLKGLCAIWLFQFCYYYFCYCHSSGWEATLRACSGNRLFKRMLWILLGQMSIHSTLIRQEPVAAAPWDWSSLWHMQQGSLKQHNVSVWQKKNVTSGRQSIDTIGLWRLLCYFRSSVLSSSKGRMPRMREIDPFSPATSRYCTHGPLSPYFDPVWRQHCSVLLHSLALPTGDTEPRQNLHRLLCSCCRQS